MKVILYNIFNNQKKDIFVFSILFSIIPIVLITGPALPDIILSSIALYFLIISIKDRLFYYYKNYFVILFFIFCIYGIINSLSSDYPWYSLSNEGTLFYFRYIFFALGIKYLLENNEHLLKYFIYISLICILTLVIDGFIQLFSGKNILGVKPLSATRITSLMFDNEAILGRYVAYLSCIIICVSLIYNNSKFGWLYLLIVPLSLALIIISGDRAPLSRYLIFLFFLAFVTHKYKKTYIFSLITSFLILLVFIFSITSVKQRFINQTINQINYEKSILYMPFTKVYEDIYLAAIDLGKDKFFFGQGPNLFEKKCISDYNPLNKNKVCQSHPHNFYLQLWAEQGILGVFFILLFYLSLCFIFIRNYFYKFKYTNKEESFFKNNCFIIALLSFIFPIIPNMSFYNNWNNIFLYIMIGLLLYFNDNLFKTKSLLNG